jgi:Zn finger protein HypA/HybF involved in hydrogenase expression
MAKAKNAAKKKGAAKAKGTTTTRTKAEYRADPTYRECATCGHFVLKTKWERHLEKHPECRSQKPKAVKKAAGKATKAKAKKKEAAA